MPDPFPIEHYKTLLETNPKWLGTQARELLVHYAELEDRYEQCLAEVQDAHDPQVRTMTKIENALMDAQAEVGRLGREIEEWEASFNLYDDACRRGTKLWQEASGYTEVPRVWPDGAKLVAWLLERLDAGAMREYAEASGRMDAEAKLEAMIAWSIALEDYIETVKNDDWESGDPRYEGWLLVPQDLKDMIATAQEMSGD